MRVEKNNTQPINGQPRNTQPVPTPEPRARVATDALTLSTSVPAAPAANPATQGSNILDDSIGRKIADGTNTAAGVADAGRSIKPAADAVRAASEAGRFSWLTSRLSVAMEKVVELGSRIGGAAKWITPAVTGIAKAAPILGVFIAVLDIGKAAIEQNPEKKAKAEGMAVLSSISGLAGIVGAGAAVGATVFGIALAPLAVPALIIGVGATVIGLADQFLLGGVISKGISKGLRAVGDGLSSAWNALTSL